MIGFRLVTGSFFLLPVGLYFAGSMWPWNAGSLILFAAGMGYAVLCGVNHAHSQGLRSQ